MAGGPLAREMVCMECLGDGVLTRAVRVHEGLESDQYRCEQGHRFGMDWRGKPATEPQWPPPAEYRAMVEPSKAPEPPPPSRPAPESPPAPDLCLEEALQQPGDLVAAWDLAALEGAIVHVYAASDSGLRFHSRTVLPESERAGVTERLQRRGVRIGSTYAGFYAWVRDADELVAWSLDDWHFAANRRLLRVRSDPSTGLGKVAGGTELFDVSRVKLVASFVDRFDMGHRGVGVELETGERIVLVRERDPTPAQDFTYNRDNLSIDAAWATFLGKDLAAFLGVPHDDQVP